MSTPGDERFLDALLARMSLADKVGQLNHPNASGGDSTGAGAAIADIEQRIRRGEVGGLAAGADPARLRALQAIACEQSPHGIPLLFTLDVIHGHRTVFPLPLALAGTFDDDLVRRTARVAAAEAADDGVMLAWAPMLDIARDARWGRAAESPGEDPLVATLFARAMVEGYQNGDPARADSVMACAKHFAGYGFAEAGRDYHAVDASPYRMHNIVLPPFRAAVEAGVGAIMVGFHDLAGLPCTAHRELLRDLLRERWGFTGLVVSDYTAIMELVHHGVAADAADAARLALTAGVDVDLVSETYVQHLPTLVASGQVAVTDVDAACRRVLAAKLALGLFDDPWRRLEQARRAAAGAAPAHRRLAREAAARACVLLKNDGVLPLAAGARIALVGPLADDRANLQGTWAVAARPTDNVSVHEGLVAAGCQVLYARGANIVDDPSAAARLNVFGETVTIDPRVPTEMRAEAAALAARVDVVVACVGEAKEHSGESATRTEIGLPGSQRELLVALAATGTPLVVVTMSGRPLALEWEDRHANAILHTWFGGSESGPAIADVLLGRINPSARLAMSFPRNAGQCPIHYSEAPTGRPLDRIGVDVPGDTEVDGNGRRVFRKFTTACRLEGPHTPLYPFGYGLGYSRFEYSALTLDKTALHGADDALVVSVTVCNCGVRAGAEVVQLYLSDPVASRSRPVRELKAWRRVELAPGAVRPVEFVLTSAELTFQRAERLAEPATVWEPGTFIVQVGANSRDLLAAAFEWRAGPAPRGT